MNCSFFSFLTRERHSTTKVTRVFFFVRKEEGRVRFTGKSERGLSLSKDGLKALLKTEEIKKSIPRARATLKKFRKYTYREARKSRDE